MKINRFLFNQNKPVKIEESIDFSTAKTDPLHIRKIENCFVKVVGNEYDNLLVLELEISADVTGVCSYSLEDVPIKLHFKEVYNFTDEEEEADEDIFYEAKPIFDLDPYVLGSIIAEVPLKIIKKGVKLPNSGDGYRVLSQDDYEEEQKTKVDHRWDKLDDVEL